MQSEHSSMINIPIYTPLARSVGFSLNELKNGFFHFWPFKVTLFEKEYIKYQLLHVGAPWDSRELFCEAHLIC